MSAGPIDMDYIRHQHQQLAGAVRNRCTDAAWEVARSMAERAKYGSTAGLKMRTGLLRGSWMSHAMATPNGAIARLLNPVPYAAFQEEGTGLYGPKKARYPIEAKPGRWLVFEQGGVLQFRKRVMHPGVRPRWIGYRAAYVASQGATLGTSGGAVDDSLWAPTISRAIDEAFSKF